MKDVNIVLLNYKMKDAVLAAVASIFGDIKDSKLDIQVTVTDNSLNQDGIREALAEKFPQAKYIDCGGNVGFGKGTNTGFKDQSARYYFALNPDTVIPPNSHVIERLVEYMDAHANIGCVGPKLVNSDDSVQASCYRFDLPSILIKPLKHINLDKKYKWARKFSDRLVMKDYDHNENRPVDWIMGSAMFVRKETIDKVGMFDDRFFMYMEDCDWCRRMWEAGIPVYYYPEVVIKHAHGRESSKVPGVFKALFKNRLARIHLVSWLKYLWKWRGNHKYYAY